MSEHKSKRSKARKLTGQAIDAMSPAEKRRLVAELDAETPEQRRAKSTAPSPDEQAMLNRVAARMGRPKIGKGTRAVSVTVEIDLLERADAYARAKGLKRAELFSAGLRSVLPTQ